MCIFRPLKVITTYCMQIALQKADSIDILVGDQRVGVFFSGKINRVSCGSVGRELNS